MRHLLEPTQTHRQGGLCLPNGKARVKDLSGNQILRNLRLNSMKKPTREEQKHRCSRKRRYRTQGDALDAALLAGVERQRTAYQCQLCGHWHLASA